MKKLIAILMTMMMAAAMIPAGAENAGDAPLVTLFDAAKKLMLDTNNVTVEAFGNFSLNGIPFKYAQAQFMQDGSDSCQRVEMRTPQEDGEETSSDYTVVSLDGMIYVEKHYQGKEFKLAGTDDAVFSVITPSYETDQLAALGRLVVLTVDQIAGGKTEITPLEDAGKWYELALTEADIPEIANVAAGFLFQYLAKHYYGKDLSLPRYAEEWTFEYFDTVGYAIVETTDALRIKSLNLYAELDGKGRVVSISGDGVLTLISKYNGEHSLEFNASLSAGMYGETMVREEGEISDWMVEANEAFTNDNLDQYLKLINAIYQENENQ